MSKAKTFTLINFFDVWGNKRDGWEVNNQCIEFDDLIISDDATDKQIISYLKEIGFLSTDDMRKVCLEDFGSAIEIVRKKGRCPLGQLLLNP